MAGLVVIRIMEHLQKEEYIIDFLFLNSFHFIFNLFLLPFPQLLLSPPRLSTHQTFCSFPPTSLSFRKAHKNQKYKSKQITTTKNRKDKKVTKIPQTAHVVHFVLANYSRLLSLYRHVVDKLSDNFIVENCVSFCRRVSIANSFLSRGGTPMSTSPLRDPIWLELVPVLYARPESLKVDM